MRRQQPAFHSRATRPASHRVDDALMVHAEEFQAEDRYEQGHLVPDDPLHPSRPGQRLFGGARQKQNVYVRIVTDVVWSSMVRVVVVDPPRPADADEQVPEHQPQNRVQSTGAHELQVRDVVSERCDLDKCEGQKDHVRQPPNGLHKLPVRFGIR